MIPNVSLARNPPSEVPVSAAMMTDAFLGFAVSLAAFVMGFELDVFVAVGLLS